MQTLSPDQQRALDAILEWYQNPKEKQYITLGGFAGTGKTTLTSHIRHEIKKLKPSAVVGFVSYTGKAARVLKSTLKEKNAIEGKDTVSTIHALIYSPIVNDNEEIVGWQKKEKIDCDLIFIDEASMVDRNIWHHLLSYQKPIIAIGDHGQLPPIEGVFNLMQDPELILSQIHRQAESNPIIGLSMQAREHGCVKFGDYGPTIKKYNMEETEAQEAMQELLGNFKNETLVLCGYNATRVKINHHVRSSLGFETKEPVFGDRVICLRNNHEKNIANGMLGTIENIKRENDDWYYAEIVMDDEKDVYKGLISAKQFGSKNPMNFTENRRQYMVGDLFDFGYALTVHKAQGSEAKRVILFEERFAKMDDNMWKKWLYTAITRAKEELYIFGRNNESTNF